MTWALIIVLGYCASASSTKSFIYSLFNINGFSPVKLQIKSGRQSYAIYGCSAYGPAFGNGFDISISNNAASNRYSFTGCDDTYHLPQGILHLIIPADFMQEATSSPRLMLKCFTRQPLRTNRQALLLSYLISALL